MSTYSITVLNANLDLPLLDPMTQQSSPGILLMYTVDFKGQKSQMTKTFPQSQLDGDSLAFLRTVTPSTEVDIETQKEADGKTAKIVKVGKKGSLKAPFERKQWTPNSSPARTFDDTGARVGNALTNAVNLVIAGKATDIDKAVEQLLAIGSKHLKLERAKTASATTVAPAAVSVQTVTQTTEAPKAQVSVFGN